MSGPPRLQKYVGRSLVSEIVPTYRPAGKHGSELKGKTYEQQMEQVLEQDEAQKETQQ